MKRALLILVGLGILGTGGWYGWQRWGRAPKVAAFKTVRIERGSLVQSVRATGTVQPVRLVQVGTQVNGPILKLGADFNSQVHAGDVVAQIDPAVYQANLAQAEANLARTRAAVDQAGAELLKASNDLARAHGLAKRELLATSDLDAAVAAAASAEAQLKVAVAQVDQNAAALQLARANLGYTTIRAPVDGVVVSRNVDEGQTVVASMSAQTLFTIATDLRTVLISASVPEADIGQIHVGQPVSFNVDAYPTSFTGTVSQVRLASSTIQNVVTYPVIVQADNPERRLFPGMTANITCIVAESNDVLKVSNAALRFKPEKALVTNDVTHVHEGGRAERRGAPANRGKLYVEVPAGGRVQPISVTLGISDGSVTEVSGAGIEEGLEVVSSVGENGDKKVVNPFMPTPPASRSTRPPRM